MYSLTTTISRETGFMFASIQFPALYEGNTVVSMIHRSLCEILKLMSKYPIKMESWHSHMEEIKTQSQLDGGNDDEECWNIAKNMFNDFYNIAKTYGAVVTIKETGGYELGHLETVIINDEKIAENIYDRIVSFIFNECNQCNVFSSSVNLNDGSFEFDTIIGKKYRPCSVNCMSCTFDC